MNDNKLIAEFIGHEPIVKGNDVYYELNHIRLTSADDLRYHTSWDWLMPVVQKCFESAENEDDFFAISGNLPYMDSTYKSVVEFIKQYNDEQ